MKLRDSLKLRSLIVVILGFAYQTFALLTPSLVPSANSAYDENAIAQFYRGKTVKLVIGFDPGGGFDVIGRIVARALPKYIPGSPTVIAVNQPGAGSLLAANSIYKVEAQDGTVIGLTSERTIIRQAVKDPAVEFDTTKVQWLASISSSPLTCVVRKDLGLKNILDAVKGPTLHMGGTGGSSSQAPLLVNRVLGTNFKVVHGYRGVAHVKVVMESKEVDGLCISWDGLKTLAPEWFRDPMFVSILSTMGPEAPPSARLPKNVPRVENLVKGTLERRLLDAYSKPDEAAMPFHFGPKVPADRVEAMRAVFKRLFSDSEILQQIEKVGRIPLPRTGPEVLDIYRSVLDLPPEVIAELIKVITPRAKR